MVRVAIQRNQVLPMVGVIHEMTLTYTWLTSLEKAQCPGGNFPMSMNPPEFILNFHNLTRIFNAKKYYLRFKIVAPDFCHSILGQLRAFIARLANKLDVSDIA